MAPSGKYVVVLLALALPAGLGMPQRDSCSKCKAGHHVASPCSETSSSACRPCPPSTFSATLDAETRCQPCSRCGVGFFEESPCTPTQDTVCRDCAEAAASKTGHAGEAACGGMQRDIPTPSENGTSAAENSSAGVPSPGDISSGATSPDDPSKGDASPEAAAASSDTASVDAAVAEALEEVGSGEVDGHLPHVPPHTTFTTLVSKDPHVASATKDVGILGEDKAAGTTMIPKGIAPTSSQVTTLPAESKPVEGDAAQVVVPIAENAEKQAMTGEKNETESVEATDGSQHGTVAIDPTIAVDEGLLIVADPQLAPTEAASSHSDGESTAEEHTDSGARVQEHAVNGTAAHELAHSVIPIEQNAGNDPAVEGQADDSQAPQEHTDSGASTPEHAADKMLAEVHTAEKAPVEHTIDSSPPDEPGDTETEESSGDVAVLVPIDFVVDDVASKSAPMTTTAKASVTPSTQAHPSHTAPSASPAGESTPAGTVHPGIADNATTIAATKTPTVSSNVTVPDLGDNVQIDADETKGDDNKDQSSTHSSLATQTATASPISTTVLTPVSGHDGVTPTRNSTIEADQTTAKTLITASAKPEDGSEQGAGLADKSTPSSPTGPTVTSATATQTPTSALPVKTTSPESATHAGTATTSTAKAEVPPDSKTDAPTTKSSTVPSTSEKSAVTPVRRPTPGTTEPSLALPTGPVLVVDVDSEGRGTQLVDVALPSVASTQLVTGRRTSHVGNDAGPEADIEPESELDPHFRSGAESKAAREREEEEALEGRKRTAIIVGVAICSAALFAIGFVTVRKCKNQKSFKVMKKVSHDKGDNSANGGAEGIEFRPLETRTGIYDDPEELRVSPTANGARRSPRKSPRLDPVADVYAVPNKKQKLPSVAEDSHVKGIDTIKYIDETTDDEAETTSSAKARLIADGQKAGNLGDNDGDKPSSSPDEESGESKLTTIEEERTPMLPKPATVNGEVAEEM